LSCNHQNNISLSNTKSNLNSSYYYENSTKPKHSWDIHGLKKGNSLKNFKTTIYEYILKEYNHYNNLNPITLNDVKSDLHLEIFDAKNNYKITNVQNFRKYSVLITAKKNAKYFFGFNNKNNFIVDLTQLDLSKFFKKELNQLSFRNTNKPEIIQTRFEKDIVKWYTNYDLKTASGYVDFNSKILKNNLDIKVIASKNPTNFINQKHWDLSYRTITNNEAYFFDAKTPIIYKDKIKDYFKADFKDINLDKIYSAVNGQDLYQKVYTQAANLVNSSLKNSAHKVTYEDLKNDQNLKLSIFYITKTGQLINIANNKKWFPHQDLLHLKVSINQKDKYFFPWKQLGSKQFHLTKMNLVNLNYQNYDLKNASRFDFLKKQIAYKLAWSYNQIFKTHLSAAEILKTKLSWIFYDKTKKKVVIPSKNIPDFNDDYTISLKIGKNNPYFDIKDKKNVFKIGEFTLNTNDLRKKFNVNNIKVLTSSKNLYDQVYTNLVNEYNDYYQSQRKSITIADLKKDKNLHLIIKNCFTKKVLDKNDVKNSLTIWTNYEININISFDDIYFRWIHQPITRILCVYRLYKINTKFFDINSKKYSFKKISQLKTYLYTLLANYYNSKLSSFSQKISNKTLMNDKELQIKIINSNKKKTDEINFNKSVFYYLTTTNKDQYFGQFTNLKLNQFSYQNKIDLATKEAQNYIDNEEKYTSNNQTIQKKDVIRWILQYLNSTKQFSFKLTWEVVAPDKDSVKLNLNSTIDMFSKPKSIFTIKVNNSPCLKIGWFTFWIKNIKYNTSAIPTLFNQTWSYRAIYNIIDGFVFVKHAIRYIASFEMLRFYNSFAKNGFKLHLTKKIIYSLYKRRIINFLFVRESDGWVVPSYKILWPPPPVQEWKIFVTVLRSNRYFSLTSKRIELIEFHWINGIKYKKKQVPCPPKKHHVFVDN